MCAVLYFFIFVIYSENMYQEWIKIGLLAYACIETSFEQAP